MSWFVLTALAQQAATATLSGRVTDPAGAVIVGAKVIVAQTATGVQRETVTNNEGLYVFTNLNPGEYNVKISAKNFPKTLSRVINLRVGQQAVFDGMIEVSGPEEIVVLVRDDSATSVNTGSAIVDGVISSQSISSLPLNGRNYLELALLIPGNAPAPNFDPTKTDSVIISSAGQLGRGGNVTIDGTDNNDDAVGGPLINISQDAVQEFQFATNRYSAELGRSASSVINVVTKAGTNDPHGSFSFFERDRRLQGLPATYDRTSNQTPPFDRQQFSATLGGPLKKPRRRRSGVRRLFEIVQLRTAGNDGRRRLRLRRGARVPICGEADFLKTENSTK
jgi:hypothetical protein